MKINYWKILRFDRLGQVEEVPQRFASKEEAEKYADFLLKCLNDNKFIDIKEDKIEVYEKASDLIKQWAKEWNTTVDELTK